MENIEGKINYCLNCKVKPCSNKGCPLGNNIPEFIRLIKEKDFEKAYKELSKTTVMQSICGRICPHQKQCQGSCVRGIKGEPVSIGELEAYIGDIAIEKGYKLLDNTESLNRKIQNKNVAIIGGGPAGLTCAAFLAREGIKVTIFEKYDYLGGLLIHGIPEFRLPKEVVKKVIKKILDLGVKVKYNQELGNNLDIKQLEKEYDYIILTFGANKSSKMNVEGEDLEGVYGGNELLEYKLHPNYTGKKVAVIGGGNVAMDCARTVKKMGADEVKVIYRRAEEQMPAEKKEIKDAKQEKIEFLFQNNIVRILSDNSASKVKKVELIKTELIEKDGETRLSPVNIQGSNYIIDIDYIIMALGSKPDNFVNNLDLELNKYGGILVNKYGQTSNSKIFAAGDIAGNKQTVAWAARSGRDVAMEIIKRNS